MQKFSKSLIKYLIFYARVQTNCIKNKKGFKKWKHKSL